MVAGTAANASGTNSKPEEGDDAFVGGSESFADLDRLVVEQLAMYRDDLLHWNHRFNLTAITEPAAVDQRLIGDALRLLPTIDELVGRLTVRGLPIRLIDVGTGAGFPGMVVKIARPDLDVTLLDATGKKVSFLRSVIETLRLDGILAVHGRAEEFAHQVRYRGQFGLATARAVSSLPALLELCLPLVALGGYALFPKGVEIDQELAEGDRANQTLGGQIESAETLESVHNAPMTRLVIVAKIRETPTRFPRRSGLPASEPLGRIRP